MLMPSARPPPARAAEPTTKSRRDRRWPFPKTIFFTVCSLRPARCAIGRAACGWSVAGGLMHRLADALIRPAAADVGHRLVDFGVGGFRLLLQECDGGHDLAGLAVAALRHVYAEPSLLHRVRGIRRQPLDG